MYKPIHPSHTAEDLGILGIVLGCFGLILLFFGIFNPIHLCLGIAFILVSVLLIAIAVLFRNKL